jgi:hypothetical protein
VEYTDTSPIQIWTAPSAVKAPWSIRLFPSLSDFAFILPVFILFVLLPGTKRLLTDGDTGWHIRAGEWILQHGTVPKTDIFSFTKPHDPWFAWEWAWDVAFAGIHRVAGLAGVAFVNACLLCFISVLLFRLIRRCCDNDLLSFAFTLMAMCGSTLHWLARPHLVSWLLLLAFLHILASAEQGRVKQLRWLPLLMLIWTNVHGGFLIGIMLVLSAAAGQACRKVFGKQPSWNSALAAAEPYLLSTGFCIAATFVNPYTWRLHAHILSYLRDSKLLDNIAEFQSISFHHGTALFFECMLLLGAGAVWWCLRSGKFAPAILIVLWGHLALLSGRNIPLFLFVASPWAAAMLRDAFRSAKSAPWLARCLATASDICNDLRHLDRSSHLPLASALTVAVMAVLFSTGRPGFESQFDVNVFPIQSVPALAGMMKARVFTYDQWGDYLIYRFYPGAKVFMDGRSDFYGPEFVDSYLQLLNADHQWQSRLKRYAIDVVVLKPEAPLAKVLKQCANWSLVFDNGSVLVFKAGGNGDNHQLNAADVLRFSPVSQDGGNGPGRSSGRAPAHSS